MIHIEFLYVAYILFVGCIIMFLKNRLIIIALISIVPVWVILSLIQPREISNVSTHKVRNIENSEGITHQLVEIPGQGILNVQKLTEKIIKENQLVECTMYKQSYFGIKYTIKPTYRVVNK